jgi:predicted N-acetyltransferase YhbS
MTLMFDPARLSIAAALPASVDFDIRDVRVEEEQGFDRRAREALLNEAFGPARFAKTSQRLREGRLPADGLALVVRDEGELVGSVRCWNVRAGAREALLLGPLAVAKSHRSLGIGSMLMREALWRAATRGHKSALLVGDAPYYARFGFEARLTCALELPGPVERARFLGFEITPGALDGTKGMVTATGRRSGAPARGAKDAAFAQVA